MRVDATAVALVALVLSACVAETATRTPVAVLDPPSSAITSSRAPRELFVEAEEFRARGDDAAARPLFVGLLASYPVLEDYHLAALAGIDERAGRLTDAAAFDDRLLATHPESVWIPSALVRRARIAMALGDPAAASLAARALAAPGADAAARGGARLVQADLMAGESPRAAYELYQDVRRDGGEAGATARERARALESSHPDLLADPELLLAEGSVLIDEGRLDLAAARLEKAVATAPTPATRVAALRALARAYRRAERFADAIASLRVAAAAEPPPGSAALFELASLLWNRDADDEARALFERLLKDAPDHPERDTARYALGRIAEHDGDDGAAVVHYRRLIESGRDAALIRDARWRLAWAPYRGGRYPTAVESFAELERVGMADRDAGLYWEARSRARLDDSTAAARYRDVLAQAPESYYAGLAEQRLGETLPAPTASELLDPDAPPPFLPYRYHWERSQELRAAGRERDAARELNAVARVVAPQSDEATFLPEAYRQVEAHGRALRLAADLERNGRMRSSVAAAYLYPRAHWSLVSEQADVERLDPYLVLALMRQESLFDAEAVSPAAAYGLMQLLVRTATEVAGVPVGADELADPAVNVRLGTRYLRQLLDRYDGNLVKTLAAYNAGEEAVAKWETRSGNIEMDEFVESISYRETRKYVKAVLGNYRRYRRLYGAPGEERALGTSSLSGGPASWPGAQPAP